MTVTNGLWKVVGTRSYREIEPGEEFEASLQSNAAARAIARGDIVLLEEFVPSIKAELFQLPKGWIEG